MMNTLRDCFNKREVWFDGRSIPTPRTDIWGVINNSSIDKVLVTIQQRLQGNYPLKTIFITEIMSLEDIGNLERGEIILSADQCILDEAEALGYKTCLFCAVQGREALDRSWQEAQKYDYLLVDFDLPTNIPLELIIARLQDCKTILLKKVQTLNEMEVVFGVMEQGSDGVLFSSDNISEIVKFNDYLIKQNSHNIDLCELTVTRVASIGMGLRACVDTTNNMTQDEGMLIGSTSQGGILVCSETHYLPYMNLRPFRVNAGAIHSYIWMPGDAAEYLSDLVVGSKVLCVNTKGETRELRVGRVKMEMRPLLLICGVAQDKQINVIVQDDWHIRIMGADGSPRNASLIRPGDQLLAYVCEPGRHVGIKIKETIVEK